MAQIPQIFENPTQATIAGAGEFLRLFPAKNNFETKTKPRFAGGVVLTHFTQTTFWTSGVCVSLLLQTQSANLRMLFTEIFTEMKNVNNSERKQREQFKF